MFRPHLLLTPSQEGRVALTYLSGLLCPRRTIARRHPLKGVLADWGRRFLGSFQLRAGRFLSAGDVELPLHCPCRVLPFPCPFFPWGNWVCNDWASCEIEFCIAVIDCKSWFSIPWFQPLASPFRETVRHAIC